MNKQIIVTFPDATKVGERHRNSIVVSNYFTMTEDCKDKNEKNNRILLKSFPSYIFSMERSYFLNNKLKQVLHVMPLIYYDATKFDYDCSHDFSEIKIQENWLTTLPLSEQVMVYYTKAESVGCQHYIRGCEYKCSTCNEYFGCRLCHDEEVDDHQFDRKKTEEVRCRYCDHEQKFGQSCEKCGVEFGWYICYQCKMICGLGQDAKPNYHCDGCGICMVGRRQYSKHCDECNSCFNADYFTDHKCVKVRGECCVCMGDMENTIYGRIIPSCGHIMHSHCYQILLQKQNYKCPMCKRFLPVHDDRKRIIEFQEKIYKKIFIQLEYEGYYVKIKCNDCQNESTQHFHPYKYFCNLCENFNVDTIGDSNINEFQKQQIAEKQWQTPLHANEKDINNFVLTNFKSQIQNIEKLEDPQDILDCFYNFIDMIPNNQENIIIFTTAANRTFDVDINSFKQAVYIVQHNLPDQNQISDDE